MQEYVLSVKVANNEGVLLRVSSLFSRRCFNIKSLNAAETEIPEISRRHNRGSGRSESP